MKDHRDLYQRDPELRAFNALERFKGMRSEVQGTDAAQPDFTRAEALKAAIQEYDPAVHGPVSVRPDIHRPEKHGSPGAAVSTTKASTSDSPTRVTRSVEQVSNVAHTSVQDASPVISAGRFHAGQRESRPNPSTPRLELPVHGSVEPGDVLVADTEQVGSLHRSDQAADPAVVGIATGEAFDGKVPVAVSGIVECRVDAGFGAVKVGDLLTASPTPGHAMRAMEPLPGTVLGKALEPLDSGVGRVRVLVMPR